MVVLLLDRRGPGIQIRPHLSIADRLCDQELLIEVLLVLFQGLLLDPLELVFKESSQGDGFCDRFDPKRLIFRSRIKAAHLVPDVVDHIGMHSPDRSYPT